MKKHDEPSVALSDYQAMRQRAEQAEAQVRSASLEIENIIQQRNEARDACAMQTTKLVDAGELHLADETTIAQLERMVAALRDALEGCRPASMRPCDCCDLGPTGHYFPSECDCGNTDNAAGAMTWCAMMNNYKGIEDVLADTAAAAAQHDAAVRRAALEKAAKLIKGMPGDEEVTGSTYSHYNEALDDAVHVLDQAIAALAERGDGE